jgi:hypothetical protein
MAIGLNLRLRLSHLQEAGNHICSKCLITTVVADMATVTDGAADLREEAIMEVEVGETRDCIAIVIYLYAVVLYWTVCNKRSIVATIRR